MKTTILVLIILCHIQIYFGQVIECPKDIKTSKIVDTISTKEFESKKGLLKIPVDNYVSIKTVLPNYAFNCGLGYIDPKYTLTVICSTNAHAHSVSKGKVTAIGQLDSNWIVIVRHGEYLSVYNSLDSVYVKKDQIVYEGENLGRINTSNNENTFEFQLWKDKDRVICEDWFSDANKLKEK
jgi:hypothetical protein